jgi:DNA-binding PadR family transcriptional regulator
MSPRKATQTPTTFAVLGQLAWGEATTYELVKAMRRNLRFMWSRTESRIYDEARRLVDAGLLTATRGRTGRRRRTVYAITAAGVEALRGWLATPPRTIALEHEPLLRVFLGARAKPEDLLAAIEATRAHADEMLAIGRPLAREYLDGVHPQQQEVHLRALTFDYLFSWALLNRRWSERAAREVRRWRDTEPDDDKRERALDLIRRTVEGEGAARPVV